MGTVFCDAPRLHICISLSPDFTHPTHRRAAAISLPVLLAVLSTEDPPAGPKKVPSLHVSQGRSPQPPPRDRGSGMPPAQGCGAGRGCTTTPWQQALGHCWDGAKGSPFTCTPQRRNSHTAPAPPASMNLCQVLQHLPVITPVPRRRDCKRSSASALAHSLGFRRRLENVNHPKMSLFVNAIILKRLKNRLWLLSCDS